LTPVTGSSIRWESQKDTAMTNPHMTFPHPELIGQFRTFGPFGPTYRILEPSKQDEKGRWLLHIQVIDTDEETDYPCDQAANDPEAR
jgi:hypothetical protein